MRIVTRAEWKARAPEGTAARSVSLIRGVCYHHSAGPQPGLTRTGGSVVRDIQRYHMDVNGYSDIAYNALIGPSGRIYEGRDIYAYGAHSNGAWNGTAPNQTLLGICFLGNFQGVDRLTERAKRAALGLEYLWALKLGRPLEVVAHRDTKATACPGDDVMAWIEGRR